MKCDNKAVVTVLKTGKTHDNYLAACVLGIFGKSRLEY